MTFAVLRRVVLIGLGIAVMYPVMRQCRRPSGWLGRRFARAMNISHARLTAWGLQRLGIEQQSRVLDVGCGGGQTIRTIAAQASAGHVDGVDYSSASVEVARSTNADLISAGRVEVQQADVSHLPFADASFDRVVAIETHYYWPDLVRDLREILRVLRPGGRFAIIAETYKGRHGDWLFRPIMRGVLRANYLTLDEHRALLSKAGFVDVTVDAEPSRGWVSAVGRRPS